MKMKRLISLAIALLLVCGMPVSVFAAEYDLAKGSITVIAKEDGQYVTQTDNGIVDQKEESDTVITQSDSSETSTTNTITIKAEENTTANVTIQDVNIVISDDSFTNHSGEAAVTIDVAHGAEANVTLDGVNIDVGGTGRNTGSEPIPGKAAVQITGNGDVTLELDGENTVQSGYRRAGVEKNDADSSGKLTITDETGTSGSLEATGGELGSGIGGGDGRSCSDITITGNAEVTATGGANGAGIGGGSRGSGSYITISDSAEVTAKGGITGAGIGGGIMGSGSNFTISDNAQVKAQGGESIVHPVACNAIGAGAAIGNGGAYRRDTVDPEPLKGQEVTPNTDDLNEGWIAKFDSGSSISGNPSTQIPGTDMDTESPDSLTYKANGQLTTSSNAALVGKQEPTCTETGHEAGFQIGGVLVAVTIPAKGHNVVDGTPNGDATCIKLGTMTGICTECKTEATVTDPQYGPHTFTTYTPDPGNLATCTEAGKEIAVCDVCKTATDVRPASAKGHSMGEYHTETAATCKAEGVERRDCANCTYSETRPIDKLKHSFTNYIYDNNATYEADGTRTAKCDHCDATGTIPAPGTRLPFYKVKGQDGAGLPCEEEKQDGVLTITVDADCASLTGTFGGIKALKARGVDTIVFVTKGAASTFAIEDLLAQGASGDTYSLTHDGSTVTFTLGNGADMSKMLK